MTKTRLLLADDHVIVRAGIRLLLEKMPSVEVVAEANNGREALELVRTSSPNLVLMTIPARHSSSPRGSAKSCSWLPKERAPRKSPFSWV